MLLIKVTTILLFSLLTNAQVLINTVPSVPDVPTLYDINKLNLSLVDITDPIRQNWTLPPLSCECSSDPASQTWTVTPQLTPDTIIRLMDSKVTDLIKKISNMLRDDFGIDNDIAAQIDATPDFNIDLIFGHFTIHDVLVKLNISEAVYQSQSGLEMISYTPIVDLLKMLDDPVINQILMSPNITVDQLFEMINLESFLGVPLNLKQLTYNTSLSEIASFMNASAFFSPDLNITSFYNMKFKQLIELVDLNMLGIPIDLKQTTFADVLNLFNASVLMDPNFNIQTIANMNLIQIVEFLGNLELIPSGLTSVTIGQVMEQFNMTFLLDASLQNLSSVAISEFVGMIDLNWFNLLPMSLSDLSKVTLQDALTLLNMSFVLDPAYRVADFVNMNVLDVLSQALTLFDMTTLEQFLVMTNMTELSGPLNALGMLSQTPLSDVVKMIDLSMIGVPLNVGNLTDMTFGELVDMTLNASFLLDPMYNIQNYTSMPFIDVVSMVLMKSVGLELSPTELGQVTLQQVLELANASFLLDSSMNVQNFVSIPLVALADTITTSMMLPVNASDLIQLPLREVFNMLNVSFLLDPQFNVQNFGNLTIMETVQMIDNAFRANYFNDSILDFKFSTILTMANLNFLLADDFVPLGFLNMTVPELLMSYNMSFLLEPEYNLQQFTQLKAVDIVRMLIPMEWNNGSVFDLVTMALGSNISQAFFYESRFQVQNLINAKFTDLLGMDLIGSDNMMYVFKLVAGFLSPEFDAITFLRMIQVPGSVLVPLKFVWSLFDSEMMQMDMSKYPTNGSMGFDGMMPMYKAMYPVDGMDQVDLTTLFDVVEKLNKTDDALSMISDFHMYFSMNESYPDLNQIAEYATVGDLLAMLNLTDFFVTYLGSIQSSPDQTVIQVLLNLDPIAMYTSISIEDFLASQNMSQIIPMISQVLYDPNTRLIDLVSLLTQEDVSYIASMPLMNILEMFNITISPDFTVESALTYYIGDENLMLTLGQIVDMLNATEVYATIGSIQSSSDATITQLLSQTLAIDVNAVSLGDLVTMLNMTDVLTLVSNVQSNPNMTITEIVALLPPEVLMYTQLNVDTFVTMLNITQITDAISAISILQQNPSMTIEMFLDSFASEYVMYKQLSLGDALDMLKNVTTDYIVDIMNNQLQIQTFNDVLVMFNISDIVPMLDSVQSNPGATIGDLALNLIYMFNITDENMVQMYSQMTVIDLINAGNLTEVFQILVAIQENPDTTVLDLATSLSDDLKNLTEMTLLNGLESANASEFIMQISYLQTNANDLLLTDLINNLSGNQLEMIAEYQVSDVVSMLNLTDLVMPLMFIQNNPQMSVFELLRAVELVDLEMNSDLTVSEFLNMKEGLDMVSSLTIGNLVDIYVSPDILPLIRSLNDYPNLNISTLLAMNNLSNLHSSSLLETTVQNSLKYASGDFRLDYQVYNALTKMLEFSDVTLKDAFMSKLILFEKDGMGYTFNDLLIGPQTNLFDIAKFFGVGDSAVFVYDMLNKLVRLNLNDIVGMLLEQFGPVDFNLADLLKMPFTDALVYFGVDRKDIGFFLNIVQSGAEFGSMFYDKNSTEYLNTVSLNQTDLAGLSLGYILQEWGPDNISMALQSIDLEMYTFASVLGYFNLTEEGMFFTEAVKGLPNATVQDFFGLIGEEESLIALTNNYTGILEQALFDLGSQMNASEEVKVGYYALIMYFNKPVSYYSSLIASLAPPCVCASLTTDSLLTSDASVSPSISVTPPTNKPFTQAPDIFLALDSRLVYILSHIMKSETKQTIVRVAGNETAYLGVLDKLTVPDWKRNCELAQNYFRFLTDELIKKNNTNVVTYQRLNKIIPCKKDCNFDRLLSVNSSFTANMTAFAKNAISLLSFNVSCKTSVISRYIAPPQNAADLINNINQIGLLNPTALKNFTAADSINIAKALSGTALSKDMAKNLGSSIPTDTNLTDVLAIASAIPLECFNNTNPAELVNNLASMDTANMDDFRKSYIANKIISSGSADTISNLLSTTSDSTMINSIPTSLLSNLDINITNIPASNLPQSFLKKYSRDILAQDSLASITDLSLLSKILPGISASDLSSIPDASKVDTLVNVLNASALYGIDLTSSQRSAIRDSLIASLQATNKRASTDATVYLGSLTTDQLNTLYPLFIEADESLLVEFSKLSSFQTVVDMVLQNIDTAKCCDYARGNRQIFVKYALPFVTSNTVLTYSDLLTLGKCFATVLPFEKLTGMSEDDFLNYFPNVGQTFQPDSNETTNVIDKINSLANSQSSQETFVFSVLNDLAMFYSNFSSLDSTSFKDNGAVIIDLIKDARDLTDSEIQKCRFGVDNDVVTQNLQKTVQNAFVTNYLATLTSNKRRRRRSSASLTCDDLNNLSSSLNSISAADLANIDSTEFVSCQTLLGDSSNGWSAEQLTALVAKAKEVYPDLSTVSDTNIAELNSICLGFSDTDLALLRFNALSSISALGSLTSWTSSQLASGLRTGVEAYVTANGGVLTSDMVNSMANLACSLSTTTVQTMSTSAFDLSVSTLGRISSACPNMELWYALAKSSTSYTTNLYTSASSISELGSVIGGISQSDLSQVSADSMSSIGQYVWNIMTVAKVNTLTTTQLQGLTSTQVSQVMNSPNYNSFSSAVKAYCESVAYPSRSVASIIDPTAGNNNSGETGDNGSSIAAFSSINIILSLIGVSVVRVLL